MTFNICIPADSRYAHKAVALCDSVRNTFTGMPYKIWVLCFDSGTRAIFDALAPRGIVALSPEDLGDAELLATRSSRSAAEFSWTCKAPLMKRVMDASAARDIVAYVDADQYFFAEPAVIAEALAKRPIGIVPHDFFPPDPEKQARVGSFNAGAIFMANDPAARACLDHWRKQCIEWCFGRYEPGRYGDQVYLDQWPALYGDSVVQLRNAGVNIGTWNLGRFRVSERAGHVFLDEAPLSLFHFHRLKMYIGRSGELDPYPMHVADARIFAPYIRALRTAAAEIAALEISGYELGADPYPGIARIMKQKLGMLFKRLS